MARVRNVSRRQFLRRGAASTGALATMGVPISTLLAACGSSDDGGGGGNGPIKVGGIFDMTGDLELYGAPKGAAQALAIKSINDRGGVLGKQLEQMLIDTKSDNALYTSGARELALNEDVAVVHGGVTSASREAMRPVLDRAEKLFFYNQQYEGGVCDKNFFGTGVVPTQQIDVLMKAAVEAFGPRIYTVAADYIWGQITAKWTRVLADQYDAEIVGEEFFPFDLGEFGPSMENIQRVQPDWVMAATAGTLMLGFYRQFAARGLKDAVGVASPSIGLGNEEVVLDPEAGEGIFVALPYFKDLDTPANREFIETWEAEYPDLEVIDGVNAEWTGVHMWAAACEKAGSFDHADVTAALEEGMDFDQALEGPVSMDGASHHTTHNMRLGRVTGDQTIEIQETIRDVPPAFEIEQCDLIENPDVNEQFEPVI